MSIPVKSIGLAKVCLSSFMYFADVIALKVPVVFGIKSALTFQLGHEICSMLCEHCLRNSEWAAKFLETVVMNAGGSPSKQCACRFARDGGAAAGMVNYLPQIIPKSEERRGTS